MTTSLETAEDITERSSRFVSAIMVALFVATSLLGATLLFAVQPMTAKMLLPSYGGTPMVWNTAVLFFQTALLVGYAYAHWSQRRLGGRRQPVFQVVLLALPLVLLPITLPSWAVVPESVQPAVWLLLVLAVMVGAPFAVLATTSPMVQRWYSWSNLPRSHDPYFLYAASNVGSLLALLAYPFFIEPLANVRTQTRWWAIGYVVFAVLMTASALLIRLLRRQSSATGSVGGKETSDLDKPFDDDRIGWRRRLRWLGLAFIPSSLMLGVTAHISTDIAPVPLMWVVPLALYLLTFIVAFAGTRHRWLPWMVFPAAGMALLLPWGLVLFGGSSLIAVPLDLIVLATAGLACHGLLAADRPTPRRLTEFYLVISVGGALGGVFNGLLAPVVFDWVAEFPLVIAMLGLLPLLSGRISGIADRLGRARPWISAAVLVAGAPLVGVALYFSDAMTWAPAAYLAILWGCGVALVTQPRFLAIAAGLLVVALFVQQTVTASVRERTFFGSYKITVENDRRTLSHGTTLHGFQFLNPGQRRLPTSYYAQPGPLGDIVAAYGERPSADRVAVVGLGAGTVAGYGRAGQQMDFYEIDPLVVSIARNPRYFTYLRDCPCQIRTIVGDGRLRIAQTPDGAYDLIILDAFSSDAVPTHLLTREAIQLYIRKLEPGGVLVFHVSNRNLDLEPMLRATAGADGLVTLAAEYGANTEVTNASHWVVMARTSTDLDPLREQNLRWQPARPGGPIWTDTYSALFSILDFDTG